MPKLRPIREINDIGAALPLLVCYECCLCFDLLPCASGTLCRLLRTRRGLLFKNLALHQQFVLLKHRHASLSIGVLDKFFWVAVRRFGSGSLALRSQKGRVQAQLRWLVELGPVTAKPAERGSASGEPIFSDAMSPAALQVLLCNGIARHGSMRPWKAGSPDPYPSYAVEPRESL